MASKFGGIPVTGSKFGGIPVTGFRPVVIPEEEDDRTLGDSVNDFVANFGVGTGQVVSLLGSAYGLATGDMENRLTASGARTSEFWEKRRTPAYKEAERLRQEKIDAAEGEFQKAGVAIWETISNPMLLVGELAKQVPNLAVGGVGGSAGKLTATTAGRVFGREVSEEAVTRAGTAAATTTGVGLSSADFGQSAYEQLMSLPDQVWLANPQVQERIGSNLDLLPQVKREIATGLAQNSAIAGGLVTYGLNKLPGAKTLEKALGGEALTGTRLRRAATGLAGETLSEGLEEGATQFTANIAQAQIDPNARLSAGVGQAAGLGAVTGGGLGLITGALTPQAQETLKFGEPTPVPVPEEVTAEQATTFARTRLEELINKSKGTPDTSAVDPVTGQTTTVPGRPAEFLSDSEIAEMDFLANNVRNPEAVGKAYNLKIKQAAEQRLNEATSAADAVQAASDIIDMDIEALEREAGIADSVVSTPEPQTRGLVAQAMAPAVEPTLTPAVEPTLTVDTLAQADISAMPAPERQEFLDDLVAARTANLPEQRQAALTRAAEVYGRTVGPVQQPLPRVTPQEAVARAQNLPQERARTAAPSLEALLAADTRGLDTQDREDFNANLAMARSVEPGPVQTAALQRAAEVYGRAIGPVQPRTAVAAEPSLRTAVPRPTNILGRPASEYTPAQLQDILNNNRVPAITRRGVETELRARTSAPVQETISENFIAIPEAVPVVAAQPVAGQPAGQRARETAQRAMDAWAASSGIPSPVTFNAAPAELEAGVAEIADLIGSQWGGRVVAFSDTRPGAINGVAIGKVAYVNVSNTQAGVQRTALHEFKHTVEQIAKAEAAAGITDTPAQEFVEQIDSVFDDMTDEGKRAYLENFMAAEELASLQGDARETRVQELLQDPELRSEMVADFLGNRATDKQFWQDLAKADPTGFEGFVKRWLAAIDNLLATLRGAKGKARSRLESAKVDTYIRDLNKAKLTAQSALINYRKATAGQAPVAAAGQAPVAADDLAPTPEDVVKAEAFEEKYDILPYTSRGQLDIKFSIKESGKYGTHPVLGIPVNKNGTVSLYFPTTNDTAKVVRRDKVLRGETPSSNRIYLTNESSAPKVQRFPGLIAQPLGGANVLVQVDPNLVQVLTEYPDGRKDFFIPIAEGAAFKAKMTKLFTLNVPRSKGLSPDRTLLEIQKSIATAATKFKEASRRDRKALVSAAREVLRVEHNVGTLLGENGKLEKTRIGDYGLTYDGQSVSSLGLGLASAQKINDKQKLTSCPQSAICEDLCLGETSGQNMLYGGIGQFRSGPRLSQYLKTEAMVLHPEEFTTALMAEIDSFRVRSAKENYKSAIRLNVTSDFVPKILEPIISAFPDVMFYDYTKMNTDVIATNHHLTYSSTGASQVVNGETIINPESNWPRMVQRMRNGQNVAMAFTGRNDMPDFVQDEVSGERFQVWNGDNYDARFLDPKPGEPGNTLNKGMIIGLTNKDRTGPTDTAAKRHKGFFLDYDRARDGDTLIIKDQSALKETAARPVKLQFSRTQPDVAARIPELERAAQGIKEGTVTREQYEELVTALKPVTPYEEVPAPATEADIRRGLSSDKLDRIGVPSKTLKAGDPVGLRLDIPAYTNHGVWVVSVHEQIPGFAAGKSIGYESVAAVKNPTFGVVESAAVNIAAGKPKATIAVMKGDWKPITPKQAFAAAKLALKSDSWVQVGMDPTRHAYFYDRASMEPVVSADEAIQVGPLVLAKNPVYGNKADFRFSRSQEPTDIEQARLNRFSRGLGESVRERAGQLAELTNRLAAEDKYLGLEVGDTFLTQNQDGGRFRHRVLAKSVLQSRSGEYELNGKNYTPALRVETISPSGDVFTGDLFVEKLRGRVTKMGGPRFSRSQTDTGGPVRIRLGQFDNTAANNALASLQDKLAVNPLNERELMRKGAAVNLFVSNGALRISDIRSTTPRQGEASELLDLVIAEADAAGAKMSLFADSYAEDGGLSTDALVDWYSRRGFEEVRRDEDGVEMRRYPADIRFSRRQLRTGEPLQLFHGTFASFDRFDPDKTADGAVWFTPVRKHAEHFGDRVIEATVTLGNPKVITQQDLENMISDEDSEADIPVLPREMVAEVVRQAKDEGFDSLVIQNFADLDFETDVYLAFNADQVSFSRAQVNTPEFKRWFGNSKVVDKNGEPLVVYHGTRPTDEAEGFDVFDIGAAGAYFTPDPSYAQAFTDDTFDEFDGARGPILPVYLSVQNPLVVRAEDGSPEWEDFVSFGIDRRTILEGGYDGAMLIDAKTGEIDQIIAVRPNQIKSAIGNRGTFDRGSPDIRFSRAQQNPMKLYSALARAADNGPVRAPAAQWKGLLRKSAKPEEITWSGVEDWLDLQEGNVSREAVSEFLAQNGVQVGEVVSGGTAFYPPGTFVHPDTGEVDSLDGWRAVTEDYTSEGGLSVEDQLDTLIDVSGDPVDPSASDAQYAEYQLPGGKNYREVLITLPAEQPDKKRPRFPLLRNRDGTRASSERYVSSHWRGVPNVLAHIRMNDRVDADGARVLFVEELQSDWAQEGRKKGFRPKDARSRLEEVEKRIRQLDRDILAVGDRVAELTDEQVDETLALIQKRTELLVQRREEVDLAETLDAVLWSAVPEAPFVQSTNSWLNLALKRVITMAVEQGYDKIAFINGEQSAERYDLSKQIDYIEYEQTSPGKYYFRATDYRGGRPITEYQQTPEQLENLVGKEIAQKIVNGVGEKSDDGNTILRTEDLKVGGEGMREFYDSIVPKAVAKLLPKIGGGKLEQVSVEIVTDEYRKQVNDAYSRGSREDIDRVKNTKPMSPQPGFTITPAMVDQVMDAGLPLFSRAQNIFGKPMPAASWQIQDSVMDSRVVYPLQDKFVDTKRVVEAINSAVGQIEDKWDPYLQEKLYHGVVAKQTKDFANDELKPLIEMMGRNRVTLEELDKYLHNRHAEERNIAIAQRNPALPDAGSGIPTADARQYLAALPAARRALLEGAARRVDNITKGTRQLLVSSGLEAQSTIDAWENLYKKYAPLMREELDYENARGAGTGRGVSVRGSSSRAAVGSADRRVVDVMANLVMQRERAIVRANKNKVSQALYGLALKNPSPDFWLPINPDAIKDPQALTTELINFGVDPKDAENIAKEPRESYVDPRTGLVSTRVNRTLRNLPNVVYTRVNGKDRFLILNNKNPRAERMAKALNNMDMDSLVAALSIAAVGTRWFASVNTQYNPIFGVINFARDVGAGTLNLSTTPLADKKARVIADTIPALRGIYGSLRGGSGQGQWAALWDEFQKVGGQTGFRDQFSQSEERARALQKELDNLSAGDLKKAGQATFNWLSDYNTAMENAVRLSAYKAALDKGLSKQRAAELAKDLTVNFNKKGAAATNMGALFAFFNASVQGTTRLAQTLRGPAGKKIISGGLLLGAIQALALMAAGFEEDEPPGFVKERNIVIPTGGGDYLTWPMPLGFNVIPNVGRIATEWALSGFERTPDRAIEMITSFFDMFNPIGNAGISMQTLSPTVFDPLVALSENKDWTGSPISREDMSGLSPTPGYLRARDSASVFTTEVARFFNLATGGTDFTPGEFSPTPEQLEYLFGQLTGGVGRETGKTIKTAEALIRGEELPAYTIPLAGRLYGQTTGSAAESNRFYNNVRRMNLHNAELNGLRERRQSLQPYFMENPDARLINSSRAAYRQVQALRNRKRDLLERKASREEIRRIEQQITNRMKQFNDRVSRIES